MEPEQCVGFWIGAIRKRRGLTQEQLAAGIGRTVNALSLLERGRNMPSFATLRRLARELGVPMRDFLAPPDEIDEPRHEALCDELIATARGLPLAELETAVRIVEIVAGARGR